MKTSDRSLSARRAGGSRTNRIGAALAAVLLAAALFAAGCGRTPALNAADRAFVSQEEYGETLKAGQAFGVSPAKGVYVTRLFAYSGPSPEDPAGRAVTDAAAVEIVNLSPLAFRCLDFTIACGGDAYRFFVTALPVGARLTAVEKEGKPLGASEAPALSVKTAEPYAARLSLHTELFSTVVRDGQIEVKSLVARRLENVTLYYKPCGADGFFGGMTRRLRFGDLNAGETRSLPAPGAYPGRCRVLFAEYGANKAEDGTKAEN